MRHLNKIIFLNSANIPYAEVMLDGNVHFAGSRLQSAIVQDQEMHAGSEDHQDAQHQPENDLPSTLRLLRIQKAEKTQHDQHIGHDQHQERQPVQKSAAGLRVIKEIALCHNERIYVAS